MIDLKLKYKGSRNYLHGSDFYNAITDQLTNRLGGYLTRLAFKHFARHESLLALEPPTETLPAIGSGTWRTASGEAQRFWLLETDIAVTESYPFDEDAITTSAVTEGRSIVGPGSLTYSAIENIIALTKRLNYALTPDVPGKWLFGQLDLSTELPSTWAEICIERYLCVGGNFSRNRITIDKIDLGEIRFIVGEP